MYSNQMNDSIETDIKQELQHPTSMSGRNNKNSRYQNDANTILPDNGYVDEPMNSIANHNKTATLFTIQELDSTNESYPTNMDMEDYIDVKSEPILEEDPVNTMRRTVGGTAASSTNKEINFLHKRITQIDGKLDIVMAQQAQTLSLLRQLVKTKNSSESIEFPIRDLEDLNTINTKIINGAAEYYIQAMESRLSDAPLSKNLERIFHMSLITQTNYDGLQNKMALKEYRGIMECLYQATRKNHSSEADFVKAVRLAIKLCKNRYFKKKCMNMKKQKIADLQE